MSGEAYVGVDPFQYLERHSRHHTAPGLIYDWTINKIEINTAPYIKVEAGYRMRDPARPGWREIEATNAGMMVGAPTTSFIANCWTTRHAARLNFSQQLALDHGGNE